ncbi:MAG TPA: glutaredoxin [Blastocatellia bacterium]|nr:glutaredoxin [Blastocatellia bacterium]
MTNNRWINGVGLGSENALLVDYPLYRKMALIIYTKPGCPYCQKAREYYSGKGVQFEDRNAQDNLAFRREMLRFTGGDPTVPAIVDDGHLVQQGWEGRG